MEAMRALTGCRDVPTWKRLQNWRMKPSNLFILRMIMYFAYVVQHVYLSVGTGYVMLKFILCNADQSDHRC